MKLINDNKDRNSEGHLQSRGREKGKKIIVKSTLLNKRNIMEVEKDNNKDYHYYYYRNSEGHLQSKKREKEKKEEKSTLLDRRNIMKTIHPFKSRNRSTEPNDRTQDTEFRKLTTTYKKNKKPTRN